ncbi:MAG: hypothetical protein KC443_16580, partial [Anaerolineales bacterium]|nr:hypothetical protein [Anaerolineales bacterium]
MREKRPFTYLLRFGFLGVILALFLVTGVQAGSHDGNVQWDEPYHNGGGNNPTQEYVPDEDYTFRDVHWTGNVYDDTAVRLTILTEEGDLTSANVRYWDGAEQWVPLSVVKTWYGVFHGQAAHLYDVWEGSISAHAAGTAVYYYIQLNDGATSDWLMAAGGDWINPLGQAISHNMVGTDWGYTVQDDDTTGPQFADVTWNVGGPGANYVCATVYDNQTVSGDNDSGVYDDATGAGGQGMYLRWDTVKTAVDGGGGTEVQLSQYSGATYCSDSAINPGSQFYFRIYAHNNDADNGLAADREQSNSGTQSSIPGSGAAVDGDVWWGEVYHQTRALAYRTPFGALPNNQQVTLVLRTAAGDLEDATLVLYNADVADDTDGTADGVYWLIQPTPSSSDAFYDYYTFTFTPVNSTQRTLYYKFRLHDGADCDWYVDDHAHNSYDHEDRYENGTGIMVPGLSGSPCSDTPPEYANNSFTITVYDQSAYASLDGWADDAVIYQILPDRFRNGDSSNDTAWPYADVYGNAINNHATWNEPVEDARVTNGWSRDFFGGDLQGVMDELDYLQSIGVTAVYFNPIFSSPSNHGYDTTDYLTVSPRYGDNALFQVLNAEAEARGIKIILDGVFNHTGSDSVYFDRYHHWNADGTTNAVADGSGACEHESSPFNAFYGFNAGTGPCNGRTDGNQLYDSWWGYDTLPNLTDYIAGNAVRDFVFDVDNDGDNGLSISGYPTTSVIQFWYGLGADGWRFDVADELPHDFWQQFRAQVKDNDSLNGPLYSEVWFEATPWLYGDQLDATMNYRYRKAVLGFLIDSTWTDNDNNSDQTMWALSPSEFDYVLGSIHEDYPAEAWYVMMNLMDSHDTNRALFVLRERSTDLTAALAKMEMMAALQFTYPGAPTIYYGDEVGLGATDWGGEATWGAGKTVNGIIQDDPYNRATYPWADESGSLPVGLPATGLQDTYRTLALTRNNYDVLRSGAVTTLLTDDVNNVYAYARTDAAAPACAIAIFNRSTTAQDVTLTALPAACTGTLYDVLNAGTGWTISGSSLTVTGLGGLSSAVLVPAFDNPNTADSTQSLPPVRVATSAAVNQVAVNGNTAVSATLYDVAGQPLPAGVTVNFAVINGGGSVAATAVTDNTGTAVLTYNAPASSDVAVVQASVTAPSGVIYSDSATVFVGYDATVNAVTTTETGIGPQTLAQGPVAATKLGRGEPVVTLAELTAVPHAGNAMSA